MTASALPPSPRRRRQPAPEFQAAQRRSSETTAFIGQAQVDQTDASEVEKPTKLGAWTNIASEPTTKALEPDVVIRLLADDEFCPGARPISFSPDPLLAPTWIFKEGEHFHTRRKAASGTSVPRTRKQADPEAERCCARQLPKAAQFLSSASTLNWAATKLHCVLGWMCSGTKADRWHNSGGSKAARNLPPQAPLIRRRYGSLAQPNGRKYRYHEYCMLDFDKQTGMYVENRTTTLFHLMLPLVRTICKLVGRRRLLAAIESCWYLIGDNARVLRRTSRRHARRRRPRSGERLLPIAMLATMLSAVRCMQGETSRWQQNLAHGATIELIHGSTATGEVLVA